MRVGLPDLVHNLRHHTAAESGVHQATYGTQVFPYLQVGARLQMTTWLHDTVGAPAHVLARCPTEIWGFWHCVGFLLEVKWYASLYLIRLPYRVKSSVCLRSYHGAFGI